MAETQTFNLSSMLTQLPIIRCVRLCTQRSLICPTNELYTMRRKRAAANFTKSNAIDLAGLRRFRITNPPALKKDAHKLMTKLVNAANANRM